MWNHFNENIHNKKQFVINSFEVFLLLFKSVALILIFSLFSCTFDLASLNTFGAIALSLLLFGTRFGIKRSAVVKCDDVSTWEGWVCMWYVHAAFILYTCTYIICTHTHTLNTHMLLNLSNLTLQQTSCKNKFNFLHYSVIHLTRLKS